MTFIYEKSFIGNKKIIEDTLKIIFNEFVEDLSQPLNT